MATRAGMEKVSEELGETSNYLRRFHRRKRCTGGDVRVTRSKLRPYRTRSRLGTKEFLEKHGFWDKRSHVVTRTGRVVLRGMDKTKLRHDVCKRAGGRCELLKPDGTRCNRFAPWDGIGHGELVHIVASGKGGSDTLENTQWSCGLPDSCHRKRDHPGPQWSPLIRGRADQAGQNPAQPPRGLDADV